MTPVEKLVARRVHALLKGLRLTRRVRRLVRRNCFRVLQDLKADLSAYAQRDPALDRSPRLAAETAGFNALMYHRLAHLLWLLSESPSEKHHDYLRSKALDLMNHAKRRWDVEVHPRATLTPPTVLDHAAHVRIGDGVACGPGLYMLNDGSIGVTAEGNERVLGVIGQTVTTGPGCVIASTTLLGSRWIGTNGPGPRQPTVGAGVQLAGGVRVLGNSVIGDETKIGPLAVVQARVGRQCVIEDGAHVYGELGDHVRIGSCAYVFGTVGAGSTVGAWAYIGPTYSVPPGATVPPGSGWTRAAGTAT